MGKNRVHKTRDWQKTIGLPIVFGIMSLLLFYCLAPYVWFFIMTLMKPQEMMNPLGRFLPESPSLENYSILFFDSIYPRWMLNSVLVSAGYTVVTVLVSALAAYAFARFEFRGKRLLFMVIMGTVMVPFATLVVPLYIELIQYGLMNTYAGVVIPPTVNAFTIYYLVAYMSSAVPKDLVESALIDGSSELKIFARIVMPLALPGLAAMAVTNFVGAWNEFFWPLIVLRTPEMYTIPVGLPTWSTIPGTTTMEVHKQVTGAFVANFPTVVLFAVSLKYYIKGITAGAVKG